MIIENVKISGFRNLIHRDISFRKSRNLIHGANGAGKTSILEAIFLLAYGKSFLNRKKSEIRNRRSNEFIIHLHVAAPPEDEKTDTPLKNTVSAHFKDRFVLTLNGKNTTIFEVNNYLYPVFFSSSDYNLYIGNKPYTRKMIDRFIFGIDPLYIRCILRYNRALKQKNFLLKRKPDPVGLRSWNKVLSELSEKLAGIKMKFIQQLNSEIRNKFAAPLHIACRPSLETVGGISAAAFFNRLEALKAREITAGRSLAGPHLDNLEIYLDSNPLKFYSSGEKKINLLMLYISFIELFKKLKNQYPVFLVDDFDTAMDTKNTGFLMENCPGMQVIATSVNENSNFDWRIELKKEN